MQNSHKTEMEKMNLSKESIRNFSIQCRNVQKGIIF